MLKLFRPKPALRLLARACSQAQSVTAPRDGQPAIAKASKELKANIPFAKELFLGRFDTVG